MLYRFYIYLGNKLHYILLPLLQFGKENRVRIIVISKDRHILLVRNWFGYQNWSLPGGGVKKKEDAKSAVARELYEETGLSIRSDRIHYVSSSICSESYLSFEVDVYYTVIRKWPSLSKKKNTEIIEKKWHDIDILPTDLAVPIHELLKKIKYE
jgi:8-oxo-dGTP pyrophosphatase MutT (NUDIX family)